jgi:hypothetical protein
MVTRQRSRSWLLTSGSELLKEKTMKTPRILRLQLRQACNRCFNQYAYHMAPETYRKSTYTNHKTAGDLKKDDNL